MPKGTQARMHSILHLWGLPTAHLWKIIHWSSLSFSNFPWLNFLYNQVQILNSYYSLLDNPHKHQSGSLKYMTINYAIHLLPLYPTLHHLWLSFCTLHVCTYYISGRIWELFKKCSRNIFERRSIDVFLDKTSIFQSIAHIAFLTFLLYYWYMRIFSLPSLFIAKLSISLYFC